MAKLSIPSDKNTQRRLKTLLSNPDRAGKFGRLTKSDQLKVLSLRGKASYTKIDELDRARKDRNNAKARQRRTSKKVSTPKLIADILTRRIPPSDENLKLLEDSVKKATLSVPPRIPGQRIRYLWSTEQNEIRSTRWNYTGKEPLTGEFLLGKFYDAMDKEIKGEGSDADFRLSDIVEVTIERSQ